MNPALIVAVGALLTSPLIGFLVATRKLSGKIGTSDATELWRAAESMRKEYRDDLAAANKRVVDVEARVANLETRNSELARDNARLEERCDVLEEENAMLREKIAELEQQLHEERGGRAI